MDIEDNLTVKKDIVGSNVKAISALPGVSLITHDHPSNGAPPTNPS